MSSSVDQIKSRIDILSLVSSYMKLDKAGASWKGKCPFHNEKTPSFFVSPDRGSYYCFGCQASGDIFTFVEQFEGLDFKGALRLLADRAGVTLEVFGSGVKENNETKSEKEKLYEVMEEATKFFESNLPPKADQPLTEKEKNDAYAYLKSRGLTDKSIKDFRIGFAVLDWRKLYDYLKHKNFTDNEIERAGLAKKPEDKNKAMYDRFRGRIMFPISDSSGRIIAFSGRILVDDGKSAKYLNSPETPIFNKSSVLFGIDKAKESIRKNNFSILVEGQMDLVLSHQAGYKNTVATSGTALSDSTVSKENVISNLGLVRRLSPNIVLSFDADKAGFNASNRAGKIALSLGMDVKVATLPEGVDPADLISKEGPEAWKEAIRKSKHIIEFILDKVLKNSKGDMRKAGREIKEKVLPFVDAIDSSIEKMHFIKKISDLSAIPMSALEGDLKKIEQELQYEKKEIKEAEESLHQVYRKDYILRRLLGIVLWQKSLKECSIDADKVLHDLVLVLDITKEKLLESVQTKQEDLIFEAEVLYGTDDDKSVDIKKDVTELMFNLKEEYLKEELGRKMQELHICEVKKDTEEGNRILKEINEINKKIQEVKNGRLKK